MSIDLNWDTLTSGPDGEELAASIRDFIHTKFQAVPLPRFIKSVKVHDFRFGSIPPKVTLKDICDPLPDFYEEMPEADEQDDEESDEDEEDSATAASSSGGRYPPGPDEFVPDAIRAAERRRREEQRRRLGGLSISAGNSRSASPGPDPLGGFIHTAGLRSAPQTPDVGTPFLGIPGGTANMHYFPSHIATGWPSGTQTPLAAVAGAQHLNSRFDQYYPGGGGGGGGSPSSYPGSPTSQGGHSGGTGSHHRNHSQSSSSISVQDFPDSALLREKHSVSTLAPTSASASRPPTRDTNTALAGSAIDDDPDDNEGDEDDDSDEMRKFREPRIEDMQAVFRIKYAGDIKLMLTAEILLDYPMPSFVGIPVKLNITGLSFDGVGVVANIRKRVHFCFLSPEDAVAAVGNDDDDSDEEEEQGQQQEAGGKRRGDSGGDKSQKGRMGGLLQEIKVESEIGQREGIKQSLKNVGKVERFVLEQVRRIFEEEFVYPSFWTFLV